jgi:hypothetical protein
VGADVDELRRDRSASTAGDDTIVLELQELGLASDPRVVLRRLSCAAELLGNRRQYYGRPFPSGSGSFPACYKLTTGQLEMENIRYHGFVLSGLTGPWSLVLFPIVLVERRYCWSLVAVLIEVLCAVVQAAALLVTTGTAARPQAYLGATPTLFLRILAGNVFTGGILGQNRWGARGSGIVIALIALVGGSILLYALVKARVELKLLIAFCLLLLAASLRRPIIEVTLPQWQLLLVDEGARYWFFPMLAFVWTLIWVCQRKSGEVDSESVSGCSFSDDDWGGARLGIQNLSR